MKKKLDTNMYVYFGSEHYDRELFKNDKNLKLLFCKWVVIIRLFTMFRAHCIPISHFFWR